MRLEEQVLQDILAAKHVLQSPPPETFATALTESGETWNLDKVRSKTLKKYIVSPNEFSPVGDVQTAERLDAAVYEIDYSPGGVVFSRKDLSTDGLLRFEDSRYNKILDQVNSFWSEAQKYRDLGMIHKRGVLLHGAPGGGKTSLVKMLVADAVAADYPVFYTRSPSMLTKGLKKFKEIEEDRGCLVILEEIDELAQYDERPLLELMDGDDSLNGVLIIGTSNYPGRLRPRLLRPGRFDVRVEVLNPPASGRAAYFRHKVKDLPDNVLREWVGLTDNYTFAELREFLINLKIHGMSPKEAAKATRQQNPLMDQQS